jgi:twinkle protein
MSIFIKHTSCPQCGSSDALAVYDDNEHCFSCGYHKSYKESEGGEDHLEKHSSSSNSSLLPFTYSSLKSRGIYEETCKKFSYGGGTYNGEPAHIANYRGLSGTTIVAQHIRMKDKQFRWVGDSSSVMLFGQWLFGGGGRRVVVTEGEIDALTVAQAFNLSWAVVSLPNGAQSAYKHLKNASEWLNSFEEIVLWFDDDPAGKAAVEAAIPLLDVGKVKVVQATGYKDANELYLAQGSKAVVSAIFNAITKRPDGVINLEEVGLKDILSKTKVKTYLTGYPELDSLTKGLRKKELTILTAGTGVGKTTFSRELALKLIDKGLKVGFIALEESIERSLLGFLALKANIPLYRLFLEPDLISEDKKQQMFDELKNKLILYDHFGSLEVNNLLSKITYMIKALEVDFLILDHLSIVVSGLETENERKAIDIIMTKLRQLVEETNCGMIVISHLKNKTQGKAYEDGAEVTLNDLRGSGAIKQLADLALALSRDMSNGENKVKLSVLKNRFAGFTGDADVLTYYPETGRLLAENQEGDMDPQTLFKNEKKEEEGNNDNINQW